MQKSFVSRADALRLIVKQSDTQIKVELSPVLRGSVFSAELREVAKAVEEQFGYVEMQIVSTPDLYAGKLCAAFDRQHPRDLFDLKFLMENEGITDDLRKTFLVCLISHNRTMTELLRPIRKDISALYKNEFALMTQVDVPLEELETVRENMISEINVTHTDEEGRFLLSFKSLRPQWSLLGLPNIEALPAARWKMLNLGKIDTGCVSPGRDQGADAVLYHKAPPEKGKHSKALKSLEGVLYHS